MPGAKILRDSVDSAGYALGAAAGLPGIRALPELSA